MKVRMLKELTLAYGPQRVTVGQVIDLPDGVAESLVGALLAEQIPALEVIKIAPTPEKRSSKKKEETAAVPPLVPPEDVAPGADLVDEQKVE